MSWLPIILDYANILKSLIANSCHCFNDYIYTNYKADAYLIFHLTSKTYAKWPFQNMLIVTSPVHTKDSSGCKKQHRN